MVPLRFGFAEIVLTFIFCMVSLALPTAILVFLFYINNRIKNIEEKLKDKQ